VTGNNPVNIRFAGKARGVGGMAVKSDASELSAIASLPGVIGQWLGQIDLLHVNVGVAELEPFEMVTEASNDRQFSINTRGVFFTVQRLVPRSHKDRHQGGPSRCRAMLRRLQRSALKPG
jgi:NAD(P)-dependent dehydrogenase (short-subunit alcohol dehydrogenase family)